MNNKIYLSIEQETILNSILKNLPQHNTFNLFQIKELEKEKYNCIITEGLTYNQHTFYLLCNFLIQGGFVEICDHENLKLTENGRNLVEIGNYKKYVKDFEFKKTAKKRKNWKEMNWLTIEILRYLIPLILGYFLGVNCK